MGARILIVDDNAFIHSVIVATLSPLGHELRSAHDGVSAVAEALLKPPDLVISDVMMPGMDGWALVRRVRWNPRLAFVPFIFLSALNSADDILRGFRLGADDYLPKPFTPDALIERVNHALQRRDRIEHSTRRQLGLRGVGEPPAGLCGSLTDVGLSSLLVLLDLEKKSGTLDLVRGAPHEHCRLRLRDGRVVHAHVTQAPRLSPTEAIYYALGWSTGTFEFSAGDVEDDDAIGVSTTGLLMEAARRADEDLGDGDLLDAIIDES